MALRRIADSATWSLGSARRISITLSPERVSRQPR